MNRQESMAKRKQIAKLILKRSTALEKSVKNTEGLKLVYITNLPLISDVDQDNIDLWFPLKIPNLSMYHLVARHDGSLKIFI